MGEGMLQEAEMSRQATLLGMQYGQSSGANMAYQQAMQNQLAAQNMGNQMNMSNAALTSGLFQNLSNIDFSGFNLGGSGIPADTTTTATASYYTP